MADNEIHGHWGALPHMTISDTGAVYFRGGRMSYAYKVNEDVLHRPQGPQGRAVADPPMIWTIVQCMPIEAVGGGVGYTSSASLELQMLAA